MTTPSPVAGQKLEPAHEPTMDRARRYAQRTRLYAWTVIGAVVLVLVVVLIAENTRHVRVGWVFGYSRVSLVFLVIFATILGWILGVVTSVVFRRRTRAPR